MPSPVHERAQARPKNNPLPALIAIVLFVGLVGTAIVVASIAQRSKVEAREESTAQEEGGYVPFSSVPPEKIPPRARREGTEDERGPFGTGKKPAAPENLDQNPVWQKALAIADKGWEAAAAASKARSAGDEALYREQAQAAKKAFDEAFTMTAVWEEELFERYSDRDPQVRAIVGVRDRWSEKMRLFHKTAPAR